VTTGANVAPRARRERYLGPRARFAAVLALVLSGLLLGAGPALAHDVLEKTNPADGSTVQTLPDEIELDFNNIPFALGSVIKVVGPSGDVTEGQTTIVDHKVTQTIAQGAPGGQYTVQWRVTSSDGHPISGQFGFTAKAGNGAGASVTAEPTPSAGAGTTSATAATSTDGDGGTSPVLVITLIVLALVVIGAVFYLFVIAPKRSGEE